MMQYEKVYSFLIKKLSDELPAYITYHDVQHTKNVVAAAALLAEQENVNDSDITLLKTAALFHDAGFLVSNREHEKLSCDMARKILPDYGYNSNQVEAICSMIMATQLPQSASNHLCQLLCDADLYYVGGEDYSVYAAKLYQEFLHYGVVKNEVEWNMKQVDFLTNHHFFTQSAIRERDPQKKLHLKHLQQKIFSSTTPVKKVNRREMIQDFLSMLFGVTIAGFALKCFLVPNHFFDGGITGTSLLLHELYHVNLALVIILLNIPLIAISYYSVGKRFAMRTFLSVILLGICLFLLPEFSLTNDKLLVSIFGGVFLGIGIGLVMRAGAALDGIEVLALYTLKRTSFTITEIILGLNILIFSIAAFKFGVQTALYSILTYFAATRSIDYVVEGIEAFTGVTIISAKSEELKYQIVNTLGRGISVYKGERGFLPGKFDVSTECDIIFTVITRLELRKLKNLVYDIDPHAFVFANTIREASGGVIKRKQRH